jgi:hypothetical protein
MPAVLSAQTMIKDDGMQRWRLAAILVTVDPSTGECVGGSGAQCDVISKQQWRHRLAAPTENWQVQLLAFCRR